MEGTNKSESTNERTLLPEHLFDSFTSAVGLALGELVLLVGRPECLRQCLHSIGIAAQATLLSFDLHQSKRLARRTAGRSLAGAALRVVRTWHEDIEDLSALGEAITTLQEVLEATGVWYVPNPARRGDGGV